MVVNFTGSLNVVGGVTYKKVSAGISSFTTWNPSDRHPDITLSLGDLKADNDSLHPNPRIAVRSIASRDNGKFYWEIAATITPLGIGIAKSDYPVTTDLTIEDASTSSTYYSVSGNIRGGGTNVADNTAFGDTYSAGTLIGVALDLDNGMIWWAKNGTWQDVTLQTDPENALNPAVDGLNSVAFSGPWFATVWLQGASANATANFGASAFDEPVPTGFNAGFGPA